jgi:hypothetical protein
VQGAAAGEAFVIMQVSACVALVCVAAVHACVCCMDVALDVSQVFIVFAISDFSGNALQLIMKGM